jgi:hypothetical protein
LVLSYVHCMRVKCASVIAASLRSSQVFSASFLRLSPLPRSPHVAMSTAAVAAATSVPSNAEILGADVANLYAVYGQTRDTTQQSNCLPLDSSPSPLFVASLSVVPPGKLTAASANPALMAAVSMRGARACCLHGGWLRFCSLTVRRASSDCARRRRR